MMIKYRWGDLMIQTAEQLADSVRALPRDEREKFFYLLRRETPRTWQDGSTPEEQAAKNKQFHKARQWIEDHKEEYDGQYVVLEGDRLIASGTDSKTVYNEARSKGFKSPFLVRIKAERLPFGGW